MNRTAANLERVSRPRRFILLPEETASGAGQGRHIRRYQLTILGQGAGRTRGGSRPAAAAAGAREIEQLAH